MRKLDSAQESNIKDKKLPVNRPNTDKENVLITIIFGLVVTLFFVFSAFILVLSHCDGITYP